MDDKLLMGYIFAGILAYTFGCIILLIIGLLFSGVPYLQLNLKTWKLVPIMIITLFFTGFLLEMFWESTGIKRWYNKWYSTA